MGKDYTIQGRAAPGYKTWTPKACQHPAVAGCTRAHATAGGGTPDAAGLSKLHIRTGEDAYQKQKPSLTWYPGASLVEIHIPKERPPPPEKDAPPRGKISEWSAASRGRLKRFLAIMERGELARALVVTLTYPKEFPPPDDHEVYKGHLHKFRIYLRRKWPKCSGVWKLEFQPRDSQKCGLTVRRFSSHRGRLQGRACMTSEFPPAKHFMEQANRARLSPLRLD